MYSSTISNAPFTFHTFVHLQISFDHLHASNSTGFATVSSVSEIAEFRVPADRPAPIPPIHTATSICTNHLPPSCSIAGSDISIRRGEADGMEMQDTIWVPEVCNDPLPPFLHVAWVCYARINISLDQLGQGTAARMQFPVEPLYRLDIERMRFVNNRPFEKPFVKNQQGAV